MLPAHFFKDFIREPFQVVALIRLQNVLGIGRVVLPFEDDCLFEDDGLCIRTELKAVLPSFHSPRALLDVKIAKLIFVDDEFNFFLLSCCKAHLLEGSKLAEGLIDLALGRRNIELDDFRATARSRIFHAAGDGEPIPFLAHHHIRPSKARIGEPVAEGIAHPLFSRRIVAVADKDALFVNLVLALSEVFAEGNILVVYGPGLRKPARGVCFAEQ